MIIGFDIDGVITNFDWDDYKACTTRKDIENYYRDMRLLLHPDNFLAPDDEACIISFRHHHFLNVTIWWLRMHGIDWPVVLLGDGAYFDFSPENKAKRNNLKAQTINKYGCSVYFDDQHEIVQMLRTHCPNTRIIQIGGNNGTSPV